MQGHQPLEGTLSNPKAIPESKTGTVTREWSEGTVTGVLNKNRVIGAKQNFPGNAKNLKSPFVAPLRNILVISRLLIMQNFA